MKIRLLSCHNQYQSKRHFTKKFAEALERAGIEARIFSWPYGKVPDDIVAQIGVEKPDLTCSFHPLPKQYDGKYFWDHLKIPHWSILVDPAFYDLELIESPLSIISCVDRSDCELLRSYNFKNTFFFPHAIERESILDLENSEERPYDVVLLGTCYDPDHLREYWKNTFSSEVSQALDDAVEIVLSDNKTSFLRALIQSLALNGINPSEVPFDLLASYVDSYSRGLDRVQLIRSIKDVQVHVIGGKCSREEHEVADWHYYLGKQSNVTIHPSVPYPEALEIMRKSKICLNSMPFFKDGTHERIFAALACGALPLTSDNIYLREAFSEDEDILFYQFTDLDQVNDKISSYIQDEAKRLQLVTSGQQKVKENHTWDQRASLILKLLQNK